MGNQPKSNIHTNTVDRVEKPHKVDLDIDGECLLESIAHFPALLVVSLIHVIGERDLLIVEWG
jgi:hypothetical protein